MLCECPNQFRYMTLLHERRYPLKSGRKISLAVFLCKDCKGFDPLPRSLFTKFLADGEINAVASLCLEMKV